MNELVRHARVAIEQGRFDAYAATILTGSAPWATG
jgi:hypothetical protein